ncbi:hypothetical protein Q5H93_05100 [Hymenobacter sp. ASUV-10]|uniref:Uncharacterized protein n=1 Tax=Hymenobacter aranciens TaxID=3063996 RepID=A0ABT9B745_9BACT|nr:hypothetical protein [Hymenobacter sp. ASUV-10]MDO7874101.1 hypothetical protein [Hymenobacter sp. ASUV-10]
MKLSLLLLLALPLPVMAQSSTFNPRPTTSQSNYNFRVQQQQRNYPEREFQRRMMEKQLQRPASARRPSQPQPAQLQQEATQQQLALRRQSAPEIAAAQKRQAEAEQQAAARHTQLVREQQRKRLAAPAQDEQLATVQLRQDMQQLTQLLVENYREVYLPGRLTSALRSRMLSARAQQDWNAATKALQSKAEWSKPPAALAAHSQTLTTLASELLGYDITLPAPAPLPLATSSFEVPMARGYFDQSVADQLLLSANQADKLAASGPLVAALQSLNAQVAALATTPPAAETQQNRQQEIRESVRIANQEMERYNARIITAGSLLQVQQSLLQATASYLTQASGG